MAVAVLWAVVEFWLGFVEDVEEEHFLLSPFLHQRKMMDYYSIQKALV
jgi:hypothetical protein